MHDDKRSGRPSVVTADLVQQIEVKICENRRFTITDLAEFFPNVPRKTVHRIVTENLHFQKLFARWVPKNCTPEHKTKRMGSALSFLERYEKDGDEFLTHIVTGPCSGVTHHPLPKKNSSRLSALAKSCARYSGTVMEFCSLITVQMDKQSMPRCTSTPCNAYAGLFKTNARDCSDPGWFFSTTTPFRIWLGKQQPYCRNFVGISWITPVQSGPRAERLPSVSLWSETMVKLL